MPKNQVNNNVLEVKGSSPISQIKPGIFRDKRSSTQAFRRASSNIGDRKNDKSPTVKTIYLQMDNSTLLQNFRKLDVSPKRDAAKIQTIYAKLNTLDVNKLKFSPTFGCEKYIYSAERGNNTELVKRVMATRSWWSESSCNTFAHFKWTPTSTPIKFANLNTSGEIPLAVNHFEYHTELSNKEKLLANMRRICSKESTFVFDIIPFSFALDLEASSFERDYQEFINCFMILNTFNKENLMQIHVTDKWSTPRIHKTLFGKKNTWLLKPTNMNRGQCIKVFDDIKTLKRYIAEFESGANLPRRTLGYNEYIVNKNELFTYNLGIEKKIFASDPLKPKRRVKRLVLQKYIERPFLLNRRKFDIRVWVLLTTEMKLYFFREGYLRTSSEAFNLEDTENLYIHLTNNAVQKTAKGYGKFESGNQLSFQQFQDYLKNNNYDHDFYQKTIPQMKAIMRLAFLGVYDKINKNKRKHCFEIFGLDFIFDENLHLWFIEVNTNPCLEESSPLLAKLIPRMIDDAFKLTIDRIYPPMGQSTTYFPVDNYRDDQNIWEMIINLNEAFKKF